MSEVYYFRPSLIWEARNPPDPSQPVVRIKVPKGGAERARKQLEPLSVGRVWVQVDPPSEAA